MLILLFGCQGEPDDAVDIPACFTGWSMICGRTLEPREETSSEKESIALSILTSILRIILARIEFFPHAGRKNVLVALIPSSIHDFGEIRIIAAPFKT